MDSEPQSPQKSTEGMVDYDKNSSAQQSLVRLQDSRIRALVGRLGRVEPEFNIVDYGCGPGTSAIEAVKPAIEAYRAEFPDGPLSVCHADQPGNDWNGLFQLAAGPEGYLQDAAALRSGAAVGSFYDQMMPAASVSLGTCFFASHWSSRAVRLKAPGALWFADLQGGARAEMENLAQADWRRFLHRRATELRAGGFLLVSTLGAVPDHSERHGTAASGRGIYRALQGVAQAMADEGLIDSQALDGFVFGLWFMTAEEARRPFDQDPQLSAAFSLEELSVAPAPITPTDLFAGAIDDPADYARRYVGYIRAFADSTLRRQLFEPSCDEPADAEKLADEFYRRLDDLYRTHRAKFACEIWHLTVVLRRR